MAKGIGLADNLIYLVKSIICEIAVRSVLGDEGVGWIFCGNLMYSVQSII